MQPSRLVHFCDHAFPADSKSVRLFGQASNGSAQIAGRLSHKGIYTPFFINCERNVTEYAVDVFYANPESLLDFRNMFIEHLYIGLSIVYFVIFLVWLGNGLRYSGFRVPLHTVYTVLPIIRAVSSYFIALIWRNRAVSEGRTGHERMVMALDIVYYTLYLSAIAFAGAGWCIFRPRLGRGQVANIIASSVLPTLVVVAVPYARLLWQILVLLVLFVFGLFFYAKINLFNIIMVARLLDSVGKRPVVMNKVKLAKQYVVLSFSHLVMTVSGSVALLVIDASSASGITFFEVLIFVGALFQMNFFLFRKQYAGEAPGSEREPVRTSRPKPCILIDPTGTALGLMRTTES
jgi:hypothetical protein